MKQLLFPITEAEAKKKKVKYSSKANKAAIFPARLREARAGINGASQQKVSNAIGISKSTLGLYENGDTLPDIATACKLASYYGVTLDYLLGKTAVKSEDITLRDVCEYTGLSETAVEILNDNRNGFMARPLAEILSFLIIQETPPPGSFSVPYYDGITKEEYDYYEKEAEAAWLKEVEQWEDVEYVPLLYKIIQYLLVVESNDVYHITDKSAVVKADDSGSLKKWRWDSIRTVPATDIVEKVLLSDIEDSLKRIKRKDPLKAKEYVVKGDAPCPDEAHKETAPSGSGQTDAGRPDT